MTCSQGLQKLKMAAVFCETSETQPNADYLAVRQLKGHAQV